MIYPLPVAITSNYEYSALRIENIQYSPGQYTADIFGMVDGQPMPFVFRNSAGLQHITTVAITDEEINTVLAARPDLDPNDRMGAALIRAMERLYALVHS